MQSLIDLLTSFNTCVPGERSVRFEENMYFYRNKMSAFERDFDRTKINAPQIKAIVEAMLITIGISPSQQGRYLHASLSVREFFIELKENIKDRNQQVNQIINLFNEQKSLKLNRMMSIGLVFGAIFQIAHPFITHFTPIEEILAAALFVPVVGLIFTTVSSLYQLYKTIYDHDVLLSKRLKDGFFLLADVTLKFTAYISLISAAITAAPLAAVLFVVAESFNVIKEIVNLVQAYMHNRNYPILSGMDNLSAKQHQARYQFDFIKHRNSILINLLTATVCLGVIAVWCFLPPSLLITIGALVAIGAAYIVKSQLHKYNEANVRARLQDEFTKLEAPVETEQRNYKVEDFNEVVDPSIVPVMPNAAVGTPLVEAQEDAPLLPQPDAQFSRPSGGGMFSRRNSAAPLLAAVHDATTMAPP